MILELKNNILRQKAEEFDFENPPMDPEELFINLRDTMIHHNGLGLSANQVGIPYTVFVMGNPKDPENILGFFNPKIIHIYGAKKALEEGCLSFPNVILKIPRWENIRYRATNFQNMTDSGTFTGMSARIFQHEFDHINGIVFVDKVSKLKKDMAFKKAAKRNGKTVPVNEIPLVTTPIYSPLSND
jgi:peptide deformylase